MKLRRRAFLHLTASAAALAALPRSAGAEAWPARAVHFVVGFPAGGGADATTRILAARFCSGLILPITNTPMVGTFGCWARAASGHVAAPPSVAKNFRRSMWDCQRPSAWGSFMQWRDHTTLP